MCGVIVCMCGSGSFDVEWHFNSFHSRFFIVFLLVASPISFENPPRHANAIANMIWCWCWNVYMGDGETNLVETDVRGLLTEALTADVHL